MKIVLATKSPRRKELMQLITKDFEALSSECDESGIEGLTPSEVPLMLAKRKALAVMRLRPGCCVIGCDTIVEKDGEILGKPRDKADELRMLSMLSGSRHSVYTGVYVAYKDESRSFVCRTDVYFFPISQAERERYADSGEPYDKAGGYAVQGGMARFVERIDGDYFNVMGLPVSRLYPIICELSDK